MKIEELFGPVFLKLREARWKETFHTIFKTSVTVFHHTDLPVEITKDTKTDFRYMQADIVPHLKTSYKVKNLPWRLKLAGKKK